MSFLSRNEHPPKRNEGLSFLTFFSPGPLALENLSACPLEEIYPNVFTEGLPGLAVYPPQEFYLYNALNSMRRKRKL